MLRYFFIFITLLISQEVIYINGTKERDSSKIIHFIVRDKNGNIVNKPKKDSLRVKELNQTTLESNTTEAKNNFKDKDSKLKKVKESNQTTLESNTTEAKNNFKDKDSKLKKVKESNQTTLESNTTEAKNNFKDKDSKLKKDLSRVKESNQTTLEFNTTEAKNNFKDKDSKLKKDLSRVKESNQTTLEFNTTEAKNNFKDKDSKLNRVALKATDTPKLNHNKIKNSSKTIKPKKKLPKRKNLSLKRRKIDKYKRKGKKYRDSNVKKRKGMKYILRDKKPIVVIIIDDISNYSQIRKIKSLPFKVTPSIFPPSNMSESTPRLARGLNGHFMVHIPLQSKSTKMNRFRKTLMVYDTQKRIRGRIKELRKLFPQAKFINNHTGSIFTANYRASKLLYKELLKSGFIFLDSKTTGRTKIKRLSREFRKPYLYRDIFLDNKKSLSYTLSQLKKGINIAHRKGYSIIIGHPYPTTFRALKRAKRLLKRVNILYIDEFYRWRYGK